MCYKALAIISPHWGKKNPEDAPAILHLLQNLRNRSGRSLITLPSTPVTIKVVNSQIRNYDKIKVTRIAVLYETLEGIRMNFTVEAFMTKKPFTLKLPSSVAEAMRIMATKDVAAVPITDPKGNYVGVVSRRDILEHPKEDEISLLMRSDLPTLSSKDSLEKAVTIFTQILRRHLPIVDSKKIVGIVTPYDILDAVLAKKIDTPISKLITRTAIPIHIRATAKMVERVIRLTHVTAFPVLDDNGNLTGLVTERDLLNGANLDSKTVSTQLGIGEDDDAWSWESLRDIYTFYYTIRDLEIPNVEVEKIMVKKPISIFEGASAYDAARIMKRNKFTQLPVRDVDDELSGIVYDFDVISSLMK